MPGAREFLDSSETNGSPSTVIDALVTAEASQPVKELVGSERPGLAKVK